MKLLLEAYPQAIYKTDKRGLTPLHMFLKNDEIDLTMERVRLLLGHVQPTKRGGDTKEHILRRRGEHLDLDLDQISRLTDHSSITGSALESLDQESTIGEDGSSSLNQYPDDVRVCFRKLDQWKRKQRRTKGAHDESIEIGQAAPTENEETNPAAVALPGTMYTPLHLAVRRKFTDEAPFDDEEYDVQAPPSNRSEILRVLISAYPQALVARDAEGITPLMTTLLDQDSLPNLEVLHLLLGSYTPGYDSPPDWAGDMALHKTRDGKYVNPAMVPALDTNQLPLHIAAEEMPTFLSAISAIYASYPGAVNVQDVRGRTPLHTALRNYQGIQPDPAVVALLLTDRVSRIRDDDGCLPFDLLVGSARNLPWKKPRASAWNERSAYEVYRKFFTSTIMQTPRPRNRLEAISFLHRLQNLPPWLRRQACAADFVQRLLIDEVSSLSTCFLILSYGALLIALVVFFRLMIDGFTADLRHDSTWSGAVYIVSFVLLVCQVCRWYCAASLSVFTTQCLLNLWAWVDLFAAILPIGTTILVVNEGSDIDRVAALGTATTGFLWLNLVGYAARSWHGCAVFMGGAIKVREFCSKAIPI
jgi:ankyrin repeat protein